MVYYREVLEGIVIMLLQTPDILLELLIVLLPLLVQLRNAGISAAPTEQTFPLLTSYHYKRKDKQKQPYVEVQYLVFYCIRLVIDTL